MAAKYDTFATAKRRGHIHHTERLRTVLRCFRGCAVGTDTATRWGRDRQGSDVANEQRGKGDAVETNDSKSNDTMVSD